MKTNKLKMKSTDRLSSELRGIKIITGASIGILIVLFSVNLYGLVLKDNNGAFIAGMVVAICLCTILPIQFIAMKRIKTELKLRENGN